MQAKQTDSYVQHVAVKEQVKEGGMQTFWICCLLEHVGISKPLYISLPPGMWDRCASI